MVLCTLELLERLLQLMRDLLFLTDCQLQRMNLCLCMLPCLIRLPKSRMQLLFERTLFHACIFPSVHVHTAGMKCFFEFATAQLKAMDLL